MPFFHMLERLKTTKREGWRRFGIDRCARVDLRPQNFTDYYDRGESISDHMYRMSLITMFAPATLSSRIDIPHCMKMALVHDMAEALVGDITPVDGVVKGEKSRRESTTMDYFTEDLLGRVNGGITGKELKDIWQEYEDGESLESKFVHDVDKIELVLQMLEYEKAHNGKIDLGEFSWVSSRIQLPEVRAWSDEVMREREEFWGKTDGVHTTFTPESKPNATQIAQHNEYYGNGTAQ